MENNLSFTEILKETVSFFERNVKNILISYIAVVALKSVLFFIPQGLNSLIISALLIIIISAIYYSDKSKEELTIQKVVFLLQSRFILVLGLTVLLSVIYIVGCMLLLIPGFYAMLVLQFATWTLIFRPEIKFFDTLQHSRNITKGKIWEIFALKITVVIIALIFFGLGSFILGSISGTLGMGAVFKAFVNNLLVSSCAIFVIMFQLFLYVRLEKSYQA